MDSMIWNRATGQQTLKITDFCCLTGYLSDLQQYTKLRCAFQIFFPDIGLCKEIVI